MWRHWRLLKSQFSHPQRKHAEESEYSHTKDKRKLRNPQEPAFPWEGIQSLVLTDPTMVSTWLTWKTPPFFPPESMVTNLSNALLTHWGTMSWKIQNIKRGHSTRPSVMVNTIHLVRPRITLTTSSWACLWGIILARLVWLEEPP